ncbi:synaptotagmin-like protein 2 isoform X2 [Amblyraja radiata]|uniref:synaptotagmin-like protein 2 isoform X2 n=1 Tax=Amblyraja radiata TaxID=386614 RepID=UPI001402B495|nr:synaptotagmin-like protein 2 isoform X2 [Amblyraja radiata]
MKDAMANNLDLSFLTDDEYQAVLKVIQRDLDLKHKDGERIRTVQKSIQDEKQRKLVTGQWFDEVKAKRYRNAVIGVDLIKASMRRGKPVTHETTVKTELQQVHQAPSSRILSQGSKYRSTSVSTEETTEESPGEGEKITAKQQIKPWSTFHKEAQRTSQNDSSESSSDDSSTIQVTPETLKKGQQRDFAEPNVSATISEPISERQRQNKTISIQHPQIYRTRNSSDISTQLPIKSTSNVSRMPRRINSVGTSEELCRTGEPASPNGNTLEQAHLSGHDGTPTDSRPAKPVRVHTQPDVTQANLCNNESRGPASASVGSNTRIPRAQNHLEFTEEARKVPEESEHSDLNGLGHFAATTVPSPVQENVLDNQKPKKPVAVRYKGAPTYQISAAGDKKKMGSSNATHIPKRKNRWKESENVSAEKLEDLAPEPVGSQRLPEAIASEDLQPLERLNLSPTSRIPRLKNISETAGENSKASSEELKQSSKELPGKNRPDRITDQGKAAFQPASRIAKYQSTSSDDEGEKGLNPGTMFTISALSNKHPEEEALTDPRHFKNLKHFWEKGVDSSNGNNDTSKIPFRKVRSPDHRSSPTKMKLSTEVESESDVPSRESLPTGIPSKLERGGNLSGPSTSEEDEKVVPLARTSKLAPIPTPRISTAIKLKKNDASGTNWDKDPEANAPMVAKASETIVQRTHSSDDQSKDSVVLESIGQARPTATRLSSNSSLDESLPITKNNQSASLDVMEKPVEEEFLPVKENARKEMHEKLMKLAAEAALCDPAPMMRPTVIQADVDICKESPGPSDSSHKHEIRTSLEGGTINLQEECPASPKEKVEEATANVVSSAPMLEPDTVPVGDEWVNSSPTSQVEELVNRSPDIEITEREAVRNFDKRMMPGRVNEESTIHCKKARSGDVEVQALPTEELQLPANFLPIVDKKPLGLSDTHNDDDPTFNAANRNQEKDSSNGVHCVDDSESNNDFQTIESGPTYGLSPVMRALARARKANAKSMDNLNSTLDRETIDSSVHENETKGDGSDQSSADDKSSVMRTSVLENTRVKELSKSVPMLIYESESDSASEISFNVGWHRKTPSDASHSSDMASVSSVSGSIMSVYSADFGSIDAQGSVRFALDYNEKNKEFQIYVSQCKDLAMVDEKKGRTDAYVKTYLLPDKARMGKRKTSVKKRNTSPFYNEILKYKIEKSVLLIQRLNLSIWHNDTLGRNSFLGEVDLDLASWDWSNRELNWYLLKSRIPAVGDGVDHRGEINLAIKYIPVGTLGTGDPPTGEVHIWMKNARDLLQLRPSGVDSFVKCYVLPDTSKKSYQKTRIVKKDINPTYNHTIVYDGFRTEDLKEACVELTVWDHEKLSNQFLGGLRLGLGTGYSYGIPVEWMDSTEEEAALWQEMMSNPNEWIPGSLALRSRLGGKKLK